MKTIEVLGKLFLMDVFIKRSYQSRGRFRPVLRANPSSLPQRILNPFSLTILVNIVISVPKFQIKCMIARPDPHFLRE